MKIVVNEKAATVPDLAEPDAMNNDAIDVDIENDFGDLRIEWMGVRLGGCSNRGDRDFDNEGVCA